MTARLSIASILVALAAALASGDARAQACWPNGVSAAADHVFLRKAGQCGSQANCLEDDGTTQCGIRALNTWLWEGGRSPAPSAGDRVTVDVGPGSFGEAIVCTDAGHVTFRGSGREVTRVAGGPAPGLFSAVTVSVRGADCPELEFRDMTFDKGVYWFFGGSSVWTDVDVFGSNVWYDVCFAQLGGDPWDEPMGEHLWFGSRLVATSYGYLAGCGLSRFYGSEIHLDFSSAPGTGHVGSAVVINHRARVEMYGSTIRVTTQDAGGVGQSVVRGVWVGSAPTVNFPPSGYGDFRMYGGIISVDASGLPNADAVGIRIAAASTDPLHQPDRASAETVDTAFILRPGGAGSAARIRNDVNGVVRSPFLWQSGPDPAANPRIDASRDGRDVFVETDCLASGSCSADCSSQACEPHVMIYRSACTTNGPWWDTATKGCRQ